MSFSLTLSRYALYTNSPESNIIGRSQTQFDDDHRGLGISEEQESGLRTYVFGLVRLGLDTGVIMEPHHVQDYARDKFRKVMRGQAWDDWFRETTHDALIHCKFRLHIPVCYGKLKVRVPDLPPRIIKNTVCFLNNTHSAVIGDQSNILGLCLITVLYFPRIGLGR